MSSFDFNPEFRSEYGFYLYKHISPNDDALKLFTDRTIKFSDPDSFNDPFDCSFNITNDFQLNAGDLRTIQKVNNQTIMSPAKRIIEAKKIINSRGFIKVDNITQLFPEKRYGVCCLNQNPLSILMWSHYANNHEGFLVEFFFPLDPQSIDFVPFPVNYNGQYPKLARKDRLTENIVKKIFLNKSEEWSYEKEYRIIRGNNGIGFHRIPKNVKITSIVLGLKTSPEYSRKIELAAIALAENQKSSPLITSASKIKNQYALNVNDHPRLDRSTWIKSKK